MSDLRFFVFMRTDIPSMGHTQSKGGGKAMAQAAHCAHQMMVHMNRYPRMMSKLNAWLKQADGFGTTITLGCNEEQLKAIVSRIQQDGRPAGLVLDPTYPMEDATGFLTVSMHTCGWAFGEASELAPYFKHLSLHP